MPELLDLGIYLLVGSLAGLLANDITPRLGLDLQGGIHLVISPDLEAAVAAAEDASVHKLAAPSEMSFEEAIKELEAVVGQLERGDVALDQSIALYERGAALKARCEAKLKEAEEKVAKITLGDGGQPTGTAPLDD